MAPSHEKTLVIGTARKESKKSRLIFFLAHFLVEADFSNTLFTNPPCRLSRVVQARLARPQQLLSAAERHWGEIRSGQAANRESLWNSRSFGNLHGNSSMIQVSWFHLRFCMLWPVFLGHQVGHSANKEMVCNVNKQKFL